MKKTNTKLFTLVAALAGGVALAPPAIAQTPGSYSAVLTTYKNDSIGGISTLHISGLKDLQACFQLAQNASNSRYHVISQASCLDASGEVAARIICPDKGRNGDGYICSIDMKEKIPAFHIPQR